MHYVIYNKYVVSYTRTYRYRVLLLIRKPEAPLLPIRTQHVRFSNAGRELSYTYTPAHIHTCTHAHMHT